MATHHCVTSEAHFATTVMTFRGVVTREKIKIKLLGSTQLDRNEILMRNFKVIPSIFVGFLAYLKSPKPLPHYVVNYMTMHCNINVKPVTRLNVALLYPARETNRIISAAWCTIRILHKLALPQKIQTPRKLSIKILFTNGSLKH